MVERVLSDVSMKALEKAMDAAALRHKVIANNIANADTPGFRKSKVVFEQLLEKTLNNPGRIESVEPVVKRILTGMRLDGNNVDIDYEMSALAKNTIMYSAFSQIMSEKFRALSYVLRETR